MPPTDEQETTMRDDFESAIADIEEQEQETAEALPDNAPEDTSTDDGEETPQTETKAEDETEDSPEPEQAAAVPDDVPDSGAEQPKADRRPPESWPPAVREEWSGLPASVRAQITKRESEINKALNDGAQNRKAGEQFNTLAGQYAQIIAAEGAPDALTGVEELFKTVATLRTGSPQQRAEKIVGFIKHYGVDINMLDGLLAQELGGGAPEGVDDSVAQMIEQRLAPVNQLMTKMQQQEQQRIYEMNQAAIKEVQDFQQNHEFYADVQNDMADLVEMAEKRGYKMPLQEAYDKACAANPEISGILQKRAEQARLTGQQQDMTNKRNAASSITGERNGPAPTGIEDLSMRDQLAALYDAQTG